MSSRKIDYGIMQTLRMLDIHHNYDNRIITKKVQNGIKINNCFQVQWYNERNHAKDD